MKKDKKRPLSKTPKNEQNQLISFNLINKSKLKKKIINNLYIQILFIHL